ncbi:MAG TPA: hypothetical protein VFL47_09260, partial [Flavisolibacter sp.]|nr:hypothetical protein [Flavisolibacter sp.]
MKRCFLFLLFLPLAALAQLQVARIFSDNMVLQRNEPIRIWGKAEPGKLIMVSFAKQQKSVSVQQDSTWRVAFKKQKASVNPQSLFITCGNEKFELKNILIGDVWLCTGQSNMEWPVQKEVHWSEESKHANQPLIRLNNPPPAGRYVYGVPYTDSLNKRLTTDA